jgi:hypothetical protein
MQTAHSEGPSALAACRITPNSPKKAAPDPKARAGHSLVSVHLPQVVQADVVLREQAAVEHDDLAGAASGGPGLAKRSGSDGQVNDASSADRYTPSPLQTDKATPPERTFSLMTKASGSQLNTSRNTSSIRLLYLALTWAGGVTQGGGRQRAGLVVLYWDCIIHTRLPTSTPTLNTQPLDTPPTPPPHPSPPFHPAPSPPRQTRTSCSSSGSRGCRATGASTAAPAPSRPGG